MGFRFRKSFGKGPFRVNFSKSGIGYSIGTKGARFTKKANGNLMSTLSVPGTGISYVKETSNKDKKKTSNTIKTINNTTSDSPCANWYYSPDPDFKDIPKGLTNSRIIIGMLGALGRILLTGFLGILLFNAGPWVLFIGVIWSAVYAWRYGKKYRNFIKDFKTPVSFDDYDDGHPPFTIHSFMSFLTSDQMTVYKKIADFCDYKDEKTFSLSELNANSTEDPISNYMITKLYEYGLLLKPVRGRYCLNIEKLNNYVNQYYEALNKKKEKYDAFVKSCEEYNIEAHNHNIQVVESRKRK